MLGKLRIALLPLLFVVQAAQAGTFMGLTPGSSTKVDADRVLGAPQSVAAEGSRCDYAAREADTLRISIRFDDRRQVIEAIDIYPRALYSGRQFREWLGLGESNDVSLDEDGNLVEFHRAQGIALHFTGPDDTFGVAFFSHFDPRTLEAEVRLERDPEPAPTAWDEAFYVRSAAEAVESKDWSRVGRLAEEGLDRYPDSASLWRSRSFYCFHSPEVPPAIRARETLRSILRAYELESTSRHASEVGWIHLELFDDCEGALHYFEMAELEFGPGNPNLYYWMARCYDELLLIETAKAYYRRFLDTAPDGTKAAEARDRLRFLH